MPKRFLAFDLGAESGRAVLGRLDGQSLTVEDVHRFHSANGTMVGHLHWNLLGLWEQMKIGLRKGAELARKDADGQRELDGIGVDTWGVDYGLLDAEGGVLGDPYHYRDRRTDGIMESAFARVGRDRIFNVTGIQFMQFNTLFQLMASQKDRPNLLKAANTMLFTADLFNYLFSGVRKAEYSLASTSQMLDARAKTWAAGLLEALGVPTHMLPEIVPSGTVLGPIRGDVAAECNCGTIPMIAPACHDTACAVAAVPTSSSKNDWCFISSGTWSLMGTELPEPLITEKSLKLNYTNEGGVGGSIRFLKNIMGLWLVQECRRHFQREGHDHTYAELTDMAGRATEFGAVVNPDHAPFGFPGEMPIKIERFCRETGQTPPSSRGEFIRTCLESLALAYRRTLEKLEDILGRRLGAIHIVGGGCQNELLNQMTANATGRVVFAGPAEATAIGNLLVQAMAVGEIKSLADARAIVRSSFPVRSYEPRDTGKWDEAYARFTRVVERA